MDLHIDKMTKTYPRSKESVGFALREVSMIIPEGECFAILGPSGCGKTTLLKCVAGLLSPEEGSIRLGERQLLLQPAEQRGFGMVFQQPLLFPHMKVIENVAFGLKMQGVGKIERRQAALEVLSAVGLSGLDQRYPNELSGGQQQRVALARAIVTRPKLLLLDEPFSSLDAETRSEMRTLLKTIHRQFGITMLFVTHDRDEAFELADRIAVMHNGKVLQVGTPMEVYKHPSHPMVARSVGVGNLIEGELHNGEFRSTHLQIPSLTNAIKGVQLGWLVIRPELLRLSDPKEDVRWRGRVQDVKFTQGFYRIRVQIGELTLDVLEHLERKDIPLVGDAVGLDLHPSEAHFIPNTRE